MSEPAQERCPLCSSSALSRISRAAVYDSEARTYHHCGRCGLIFTSPTLSAEEERARYLTHRNGPDQPGHVAFLRRALEPLSSMLRPGMHGLDYGCGPVPTASVLLRREGFACDDFDPHFFPTLPVGPYDFIVATEVFEHFHNPALELERLSELLAPGGVLAVMTEQWKSLEQFRDWYYPRDLTHLCFYHRRTFDWICSRYGFSVCYEDADRVVALRALG